MTLKTAPALVGMNLPSKVVIPGASETSEPGIHFVGRGFGCRVRAARNDVVYVVT